MDFDGSIATSAQFMVQSAESVSLGYVKFHILTDLSSDVVVMILFVREQFIEKITPLNGKRKKCLLEKKSIFHLVEKNAQKFSFKITLCPESR